MRDEKAQVWIETAIYTLIGLTIIGIVLSVATPQIEKAKERSIISQTAEALETLNNQMIKVEQSGGSIKIVELKIIKGKLEIDPVNDEIRYTLENTKLKFSETGQEIKEGAITYVTQQSGRGFDVILKLGYENIDVTFEESNGKIGTLHGSPAPYKIKIENVGDNLPDEKVHVDFELV